MTSTYLSWHAQTDLHRNREYSQAFEHHFVSKFNFMRWTKTDQVFHVAVLRLATRYCIRRIAHHISDKLFKHKHILLHLAKHISQVSYRHKIIYIQSFNITKSHTNAIHTLTMSYTYIYIQQIDSLSDTLTIGIFSLFSCDTKF